MIPTIITFERLLRREVSQNGKSEITKAIKGEFYSSSLDAITIWKHDDTIEILTLLYSLTIYSNLNYTITYIGSSKHERLAEGWLQCDIHPHLHSLISLL